MGAGRRLHHSTPSRGLPGQRTSPARGPPAGQTPAGSARAARAGNSPPRGCPAIAPACKRGSDSDLGRRCPNRRRCAAARARRQRPRGPYFCWLRHTHGSTQAAAMRHHERGLPAGQDQSPARPAQDEQRQRQQQRAARAGCCAHTAPARRPGRALRRRAGARPPSAARLLGRRPQPDEQPCAHGNGEGRGRLGQCVVLVRDQDRVTAGIERPQRRPGHRQESPQDVPYANGGDETEEGPASGAVRCQTATAATPARPGSNSPACENASKWSRLPVCRRTWLPERYWIPSQLANSGAQPPTHTRISAITAIATALQ